VGAETIRLWSLTEATLVELGDDGSLTVVTWWGEIDLTGTAEPVRDFAGASACDAAAHGRFCRALLERGVYPPASQFEAWFPSLAHDDESIDRTIEAAEEAFQQAMS